MAVVYDDRWRKLAKQVLREAGWQCEAPGCTRRATSADHIVPVSEAPHLRLVRSNVRAACSKHNEGRVSPRMARMAQINRAPAPRRKW